MKGPARDVVIIGGGPAGITTALALERARPELAARVLVLEKGRYPREKFCAGALGARGDKILASLDAVPDVASVPVDGISFRGADGEIAARVGSIGRVVRRIEFDHALAAIARARGIEVLDGTRVDAVRIDGADESADTDAHDSCATLETSRGTIRARIVVGADGVGSVVRKAMGLGAGALRAQVLEVDTETVAGDRDRGILHFDAADRRLTGYSWDFPTVIGGRPHMCRGIYRLKTAGADSASLPLEQIFAERLAAMGLDLASYKNKRYAERGFDPVEEVARGPLMLVGEAAGIDPVTGEGIAQAIEYGALAGRFLANELTRDADAPRADGWSAEVRGSRIRRDLRLRTGFVPFVYGETRDEMEHFLLESSDLLHVGCQHFAAQPYDWLRLANVIGRGASRWAGIAITRALRA